MFQEGRNHSLRRTQTTNVNNSEPKHGGLLVALEQNNPPYISVVFNLIRRVTALKTETFAFDKRAHRRFLKGSLWCCRAHGTHGRVG